MSYLSQVGLAVTRLGNALLGGLADETMSSRALRMYVTGKPWGVVARPIIDAVFDVFGDDNHCLGSYHSDRSRPSLPTVDLDLLREDVFDSGFQVSDPPVPDDASCPTTMPGENPGARDSDWQRLR